MPQPLKTFIIYSRKNIDIRDELLAHLKPLEAVGEIDIWYDEKLTASESWDEIIQENLSEADMILLLVSKHFFVSEYIEKKEIKKAIAQHEEGKSNIIPIIVSNCRWQSYFDIGKYQALPESGKPIKSKHWYDEDEAMTNVVEGIERTILKIQEKIATKAKEEGGLKNDPIPPKVVIIPPSEKSETIDPRLEAKAELAWTYTQALKGKKSYEAGLRLFIKNYAGSSFEPLAQKELDALLKPLKETALFRRRKKEEDQMAWTMAKELDSFSAFKTYLEQHPSGRYYEEVLIALDQFFFQEMVYIEGGSNPLLTTAPAVLSFELCKFPVTFHAYDAFCKATNREILDGLGVGRKLQPASSIHWYDAIEFCNWLSIKHDLLPVYSIDKDLKYPNMASENNLLAFEVERKEEANGYRLPTVHEWEFAAMGGVKSQRFKFSGSNDINEVGWCSENSDWRTHPVGGKDSNELGLFDMTGNVWEWCLNWQRENGAIWEMVETKEYIAKLHLKGGSWKSPAKTCRLYNRSQPNIANRKFEFGFRLAKG